MKRLIVAITGASGVIYGIRALEILRKLKDIESHVILSPSAARTMAEETDYAIDTVKKTRRCDLQPQRHRRRNFQRLI